MIGLGIWLAGRVTGTAGGLALGYLLGRGQRGEGPIEIGRRRYPVMHIRELADGSHSNSLRTFALR